MSEDKDSFLEQIRQAATERVLFLAHAVSQMNAPARMITTVEVHAVIFEGQIIEDYPDDPRGHSCLMLGYGVNSRPVHIVCAPKDDYLAVITAYLPSPEQWHPGWRTRRQR